MQKIDTLPRAFQIQFIKSTLAASLAALASGLGILVGHCRRDNNSFSLFRRSPVRIVILQRLLRD
jgi:hypothetical protein